jgi:hypothetical protein
MPKHGTHACYAAGCRRPACTKANTDYWREYRAKQREELERLKGVEALDRAEPTKDLKPSQRKILLRVLEVARLVVQTPEDDEAVDELRHSIGLYDRELKK